MTDNLPTEAQCRAFTLLLGVEWHEIKSEGYYDGIRQVEQPKCSCGKKSFLFLSELKDHIARNNPTYSDSASILAKMKEKLGEEKYRAFLFEIFYFEANDPLQTFVDKFIFSPALLIGKATEFMKEKGE
jgi:hypothetical protein